MAMDPKFLSALGGLLEAEGGYSDRKHDRGGKTMWGITQRTYNRWLRCHGREPAPVSELSVADMQAIYFDEYWSKGRCGELPAKLDLAQFDACVNHGPWQATVLLQRALQMSEEDVDGLIGPKTIGVARHRNVAETIQAFLGQRDRFYRYIASNDVTQHEFLAGWINRLDKLRRALLGPALLAPRPAQQKERA